MATSYLTPGVYVEEVDKGSKAIEGVGTSLAAFVGFAERGPVNEPRYIANWTQFTNTFGTFLPGGFLAHAVYGFFNNGGTSCYITRLAMPEEGGTARQQRALPAASAQLPARAQGAQGLEITARDAGTAGSNVQVEVTAPTAVEGQPPPAED